LPKISAVISQIIALLALNDLSGSSVFDWLVNRFELMIALGLLFVAPLVILCEKYAQYDH